ncbi:MAG: hypothetical protein Kow0069_04940 [Promethearchaeota archaeon]
MTKKAARKPAKEVAWEEKLSKILKALLDAGRPLTTTEVGERSGLSRPTTRKYLKELVEQGKVVSERAGPVTLYSPKDKQTSPQGQVDALFRALVEFMQMKTGTSPRSRTTNLFFTDLGRQAARHLVLAGEALLPRFEEQSFCELEAAAKVVRGMLQGAFPGIRKPQVERLPRLGETKPRSLLFRVDLRDVPSELRAPLARYSAGVVEAKLKLRGIPLVFQLVEFAGEVAYFELGYEARYWVVFWVEDCVDGPGSELEGELLRRVREWFSFFVPGRTKTWREGGHERVKITVRRNRDLEQFLELLGRTLLENLEIALSLGLKASRQWLPYEEWPEPTFAQVRFDSNAREMLEYLKMCADQVYPNAAYRVHYASHESGWDLFFHERLDFDALFSAPTDPEAIERVYRATGVNSETFFAIRREKMKARIKELTTARMEFRRKRRSRWRKA